LNVRRKLGPTYIFWAGWKPLVVLCDADDMRKMLNDKEELFYKTNPFGANPTLPRVMGTSLLTISGTKWKSQRRAMDPAFQYKKIRTLVPLFARCTNKLIQKWERQCSNGPVKVEEGLTALTLDAIGLGAFGYDFGAVDGSSKKTSENLEHYHGIMKSMFRPLAFIFPFVTKLPTAFNAQLDQRIRKFQAFLSSVIESHRQGKTDGEDLDLLDHIIAMDEDGQLSDEEISHNLFLFFLAGHDTSASGLTSALYYFAKYPEMQQRAYEEVLSSIPKNNELTFGDLSKFEYLNRFLKETLRLRAPVMGTTARTVQCENGVVLGDYLVPKGTAVGISIWNYHYDERFWSEPYTFKPDRWDKHSQGDDAQQEEANDILTFSMGPRICIGKKFALTEMLTVLAMLLLKFEFQLPTPDYEWKFRPFSITLRPHDGLPLQLRLRQARPPVNQ